jgi:hypothetical protein
MNDHKEFPANLPPDEPLLERLSALRFCAPPVSTDSCFEEKLLRRSRRKSGPAGFSQWRADGCWEAVLISILFGLLGLDLFHIIRLVLR